jgi:hypothetical protein
MDEYIPEPVREIDKAFLMAVEDVFSIKGRGTVGTGRIDRGRVKVGDAVEIIGFGIKKPTTVTGVEMFQKSLDEGVAGDNVGILLRGIEKNDLQRGQVVCKPGSITPHSKFEAEVYVLSKEEGGRHTPFFKGYRPQFYIRTTDVTGSILKLLSEDGNEVEMCMPGDNIRMDIQLDMPIAIEESLRFAIREGGRTVGAGVVTRIKVSEILGEGELRPTGPEKHLETAVTEAASRHLRGDLEIDGANYPLRSPVIGVSETISSTQIQFQLPDFGPIFIGKGSTGEEAYEDWCDQIHAGFQALHRKRPFEHSEGEQLKWVYLNSLINVEEYKRKTPIVVNETGRISAIRGGMRDVIWWPDDRWETIPSKRMPYDFAGFGVNQWFDAVVERGRSDWKLHRGRHVQAIDPIPESDEGEADELLASSKTLADLPEAPIDEDEL